MADPSDTYTLGSTALRCGEHVVRPARAAAAAALGPEGIGHSPLPRPIGSSPLPPGEGHVRAAAPPPRAALPPGDDQLAAEQSRHVKRRCRQGEVAVRAGHQRGGLRRDLRPHVVRRGQGHGRPSQGAAPKVARRHAGLARAPASQLLPHGGAAHREQSDHGDLRDALRLRRRAHAQRPVGVHLQLGGDVGQLDPHDVHHRLLPELLLQPALCAARPRAMAHTRASASRRRPPHPRPPARHLSRATRAPAARPQTSSTSRRAAAAAASSRRAC